ncbi:hypothetical protein [Sphingomonas beigongshangi]|uniref:hypothetical protein n=1 Tax=Sphingomonas beigongshangi TaxID=2782540 RepID=UPI001AEEC852|nr:hypothetical protein [Sphingomonas beigongshangi]
MTRPTYSIDFDAPGEFLRLTLRGDWDTDITERFAADVATTLRKMLASGTRHGHLRTLIDMREKNLLPQNVVAEFAKMVRPDSPSFRIAMIVATKLHALQAKRISDDKRAVFDSEAAAMAWLMEGAPAPLDAQGDPRIG